jgi:hypothetical protein
MAFHSNARAGLACRSGPLEIRPTLPGRGTALGSTCASASLPAATPRDAAESSTKVDLRLAPASAQSSFVRG